MDDEDDDDFAALFEDFSGDEIAELSERISDNLRQSAGIAGKTTVHEGEGDEGRMTWEAPAWSGLGNETAPGAGIGSAPTAPAATSGGAVASAAEEAEDSLWADLAPDGEDAPTTAMSENILQAKQAVEMMAPDEAAQAADVFDKLAAHGKGFAVLDVEEFQSLLLKLATDERGKKLLRLLLSKVRG